MSVKGKVKRCNKEIKELKDKLETSELSNKRLRKKLDTQNDNKILENIIKFAITNHIGNFRGGIAIDMDNVDRMNDLKFDIRQDYFEHKYIIRVT